MGLSVPQRVYWWAVSFIGGVFWGSYLSIQVSPGMLFFILGVWLVSFFFNKKIVIFILGSLAFLAIGVFLYNQQSQKLSLWQEKRVQFNKTSKREKISGRVASEFDRRQDNARFVLETEKGEKYLVFTSRYPYIDYGSQVGLTGKVVVPGYVEDFDWQGYLAARDIYKVIFYPEVGWVNPQDDFSFKRSLFNVKRNVRAFLKVRFSSKKSQVLRAVLLGDKVISDSLRDKLSKTGTNHIVAISGLHIMIFISSILGLGVLLGLSRPWAISASLLVAFLFVFQTGFRISALRAFIMAAVLYGGYISGRVSSSGHTLVLVGAGMLAFNPLLLRFSVGFQLSFLALLGIVYFKDFFEFVFDKFMGASLPRDILIMTLGAQLGVLPIISYNFGRFSALAPLANVFILFIISALMSVGLLIFVLAPWASFWASILGYIAGIILDYIFIILSALSRLDFLYFNTQFSLAAVAAYYLFLVLFLIWWRKFYRKNLTPAAKQEKIVEKTAGTNFKS